MRQEKKHDERNRRVQGGLRGNYNQRIVYENITTVKLAEASKIE